MSRASWSEQIRRVVEGLKTAKPGLVAAVCVDDDGLANDVGMRFKRRRSSPIKARAKAAESSEASCTTCSMGNADGRNSGDGGLQRSGEHGLQPKSGRSSLAFGVAQGDTEGERSQGQRSVSGETGRRRCRLVGLSGEDILRGFWRDTEWLYCNDEKYRPVEPGTFPLAHGAAARVGRLRGYGNGLVATQAAAFIQAYQEVRSARIAAIEAKRS